MEKIIKVALETKFGANAENMMEVILMTPNSNHAVELLLGIYEEPKFKQKGTYTYKYKGEAFKNLDATFESYNPWLNSIDVIVIRPVTKDIAILQENREIVNKDNYTEYELSKEQRSKCDKWEWKTVVMSETELVRETIDDGIVYEWIERNEL